MTSVERKPLASKEINTMSELTPNTKSKLDVDISDQLRERKLRMQAAYKKAQTEQAASAVEIPETTTATTAPIAPEAEQPIATTTTAPAVVPVPPVAAPVLPVVPDVAPVVVPAAPITAPSSEEATVNAASVKPAFDIPTKAVAPEITPPANPAATTTAPAEPVQEEKKERRRTRLDGQDGLQDAVCLLPERRPRVKREKEVKRPADGTIPPPRLSGDAPARAVRAPREEKVKKEKTRPRVPPLNLRGVGGPAPDADVPPMQPTVSAPVHDVRVPAAHHVGMGGAAARRQDVFSRDYRAGAGVAGRPGAYPQPPAADHAMPYAGLYRDPPRMPHPRDVPAMPAPMDRMHAHPMHPMDIGHAGGLMAPPRPLASHAPVFPCYGASAVTGLRPAADIGIGAPSLGLPRDGLDDAAIARLIARQEYGW